MRLLIVAMPENVHTARWINQIADQGWDIHLFPAYDAWLHPTTRNVTFHTTLDSPGGGVHPSIRVRRPRGLEATLDAPRRLAEVIREIKPDLIHSMEFEHSTYPTLEARAQLFAPFPIWIVSNWGSDIYLFGRLPRHAERIRRILSLADYYSCECCRDVLLARAFGFRGEVWPVLPMAGGFDLDHVAQFRSPGPTSARRVVALKGYQSHAGRALVGIKALELAAEELQGYRVVVYSHTPDVAFAAELASRATGVPFEMMPRSSHEDMLRLYGRARVYLGLSISDGISTSLLEALVMGAFPVQSHTACANEWVKNGECGMIVPPEEPHAIAAALRRALTDDALVDWGAARNAEVSAQRLDARRLGPLVVELYRRALARGRSPHTAEKTPAVAVSAWERLGKAEEWLQVRQRELAEQQGLVRSLSAELAGRCLEIEGQHSEIEALRSRWYVRLGQAVEEWARQARGSRRYQWAAGLCRRLGLTPSLKRFARRCFDLVWRGGRGLKQYGISGCCRKLIGRVVWRVLRLGV